MSLHSCLLGQLIDALYPFQDGIVAYFTKREFPELAPALEVSYRPFSASHMFNDWAIVKAEKGQERELPLIWSSRSDSLDQAFSLLHVTNTLAGIVTNQKDVHTYVDRREPEHIQPKTTATKGSTFAHVVACCR